MLFTICLVPLSLVFSSCSFYHAIIIFCCFLTYFLGFFVVFVLLVTKHSETIYLRTFTLTYTLMVFIKHNIKEESVMSGLVNVAYAVVVVDFVFAFYYCCCTTYILFLLLVSLVLFFSLLFFRLATLIFLRLKIHNKNNNSNKNYIQFNGL